MKTATCLYCEMDTAMNHELNCPLHPDNQELFEKPKICQHPQYLMGWRCPVCGSVYSPFESSCPRCANSNIKTIATGTTHPRDYLGTEV